MKLRAAADMMTALIEEVRKVAEEKGAAVGGVV